MESIGPDLENAMPLLNLDSQIEMVIGPAMFGAMTSHFIFKHVGESLGLAEFDDNFYIKYPAVIADMMVTGIMAVVLNAKQGKYEKLLQDNEIGEGDSE